LWTRRGFQIQANKKSIVVDFFKKLPGPSKMSKDINYPLAQTQFKPNNFVWELKGSPDNNCSLSTYKGDILELEMLLCPKHWLAMKCMDAIQLQAKNETGDITLFAYIVLLRSAFVKELKERRPNTIDWKSQVLPHFIFRQYHNYCHDLQGRRDYQEHCSNQGLLAYSSELPSLDPSGLAQGLCSILLCDGILRFILFIGGKTSEHQPTKLALLAPQCRLVVFFWSLSL
jgi:hypothetical protein